MTFVLIPGAGGEAWFWHRLVAELERRGHGAVAVDLPAGDESAGWAEYADAVVAAARGVDDAVLVAQSMGGFTAPLVCDRLPVRLLVLLNAMIPVPGETGGAWWENTGQSKAQAELAAAQGRVVSDGIDVLVDFFHDVPADVTAEAMRRGDPSQSMTPSRSPGRWTAGRTCRPGWSAAATTACSRWSSSVASPVSASAWTSTRSRAATWRR